MEAVRVIRSGEEKACQNCGKVFARDKRYSRKYFARQKYCSQVCAGQQDAKRQAKLRPTLTERFWADVLERDFGKCWIWQGTKTKGGYATFGHDGKQHRPHRVALQLSNRPIPKGYHACHTCHNKWCVNPAHLYVGTPAQNSLDACKNGSHARKLSVQDVHEIRDSDETVTALAKRFNVSDAAINKVLKRKSWKHV